eukprot:7285215-Ditylum_brightwellii.AAC.1
MVLVLENLRKKIKNVRICHDEQLRLVADNDVVAVCVVVNDFAGCENASDVQLNSNKPIGAGRKLFVKTVLEHCQALQA